MSRLEIKVDGKDVDATAMLRVAMAHVKLLKSTERELAKKAGRKVSVLWRIDMQSGNDWGLIAIRGETKGGTQGEKEWVALNANEVLRRVRQTGKEGK